MKFQLNPYNRGLSDEELLADLRAVAARLNKEFITKGEYKQFGRLHPATFQRRFGSWGEAHERAGLTRIRNFDFTIDGCIIDIQRVAELLRVDCLGAHDYDAHGRFSTDVVRRRFGSWNKADLQAGLRPYREASTNEELFENLERLWEALGRQPTRSDFVRPLSRYSYDRYPRRFGSYRKALEVFVASFDKENDKSTQTLLADASEPLIAQSSECLPVTASAHIHKTLRNINWRQRFLVMRRDNFKCRLCGVSPAVKPGTILVVDHVIAWASGGETVLDNLQTLCEPCNGGKGALPLTEAVDNGLRPSCQPFAENRVESFDERSTEN